MAAIMLRPSSAHQPHFVFAVSLAVILVLSFTDIIRNYQISHGVQISNTRAATCPSFKSSLVSRSRAGRFVARLIKDPNLLSGSGNDQNDRGNGENLIGMGADADKMEWDPEGILGPRQGGHLNRLDAQLAEERNKAEYDRIVAEQQKEAEEARKRREARIQPANLEDLDAVIEYFLDTHPADMEHEVARMRPAITPALLKHMDRSVNMTKLSTEPTQAELDKMYEYEALSQVLKEGIIMFDTMKMQALRAQENVKFLLTAKDKKSAILELAGKNEIDDTFIVLLESNAQAAKAAGQDKAAEFILKLRNESTRYIIKPIAIPLRENEMGGPAGQE